MLLLVKWLERFSPLLNRRIFFDHFKLAGHGRVKRLTQWGLSLLMLLPAAAAAQRPFSLTVAARAHISQARFSDNALVNARVSLAPNLYSGWLLGAALDLSPRVAFQAALGYSSYGLAIETQQDYPGWKYAASNVAAFQRQAIEVAAVLRRRYFTAEKPGRAWFTDLGADVLLASFGSTAFGFSNYDADNPNTPGIFGQGTPVGGNPYRIGIRLGAGREWAIMSRSHLSLQALVSIGTRDLNRDRLDITVWQQGRTIDPVRYSNSVATRASFAGIQAQYRFQL